MKEPKTITCIDSCHWCKRSGWCKHFGDEGYLCKEYKHVETDVAEDNEFRFGWKKINYDLI